MKVLHVHRAQAAGADGDELVAQLVAAQARMGVTVCLALISVGASRAYAARLAAVVGPQVCTEVLGVPFELDPRLPVRLHELAARWTPDVIHSHNTSAILLVPAALAFSSAALVASRHGEPSERWLVDKGLAAALSMHHGLISDCEPGRIALESKTSVAPPLIRVVRPGHDAGDSAEHERFGVRAEWGVESDDVLFGTTGALVPQKGQELLLEAFARHLELTRSKRARLAIVGSGPLEDELVRRARKLGVWPRAFVARTTPGRAIAAIDIYAQSSLSGELGLTTLAAMAAGKPVIGSDADVLPELIAHRVTGLVVPRSNAVLLAEAMAELGGSPALAAEMGRMGRLRHQSSLGAERMAAETVAVYERAMADAARGRGQSD